MGIAAVDKLPTTPVFVSSGRARLTGSVIGTATELVLPKIGFEGPVLSRCQIGRRSRWSHGDDVKIYQIFIVAGRVSLELVFGYFLSAAARHWNSVPVVMKIYNVGKTCPDGKKICQSPDRSLIAK